MNISLKDYEIIFDDTLSSLPNFLAEHKYSKVFVVVDENTKQHCLPILQNVLTAIEIIETKSGEIYKNIATCEFIWQQLIEQNADRKSVIINLGGGVIGDMSGFAASCYKRGIDFINIPTTLLSQVDSSIGGKLGIDFKYGKNLIGLFRNPKLVLVSSQFLKTLPKRQFINGWSEIIKHALIKDKAQWLLYKNIDIHNCDMNAIVFHSLQIKKAVVEADPYENGLRKILNFGHTIGHAIEAYSLEHDETPLLHGEAIAIGMICESFLSVKKCGLTQDELNEITKLILKYFPKYNIENYNTDKIITSMLSDKKNNATKILAALLSEIGNSVFDIEINKDEILESLNYYNSL
ncbi:MAG: 3-dehydroquinate synthase [Saprospirales bacterium]|nr:3-dehydroquinate synthase [Saprospirales bacterium]